MPKISVFCCGVQKGGTTSLYSHFTDHPALQAPSRKELHIFDNESVDWSQSVEPIVDGYFEHAVTTARMRFDITPIYIFWPNAIERLHQYNPNAKLICLFRDPFERAFSQWCMEYARGDETLSFAEAIRDGRTRMVDVATSEYALRHYSYIERGFYGEQVDRLYSLFPKEQLLFLRSEDLSERPSETLASVCQFLDIEAFQDTRRRSENVRPAIDYPSMFSADDLAFAATLFTKDLVRFSQLTGIDISDWQTVQYIKQRVTLSPDSPHS